MKECRILARLDPQNIEPSWVFSTADAYVEMDLGQEASIHLCEEENLPQNFRRPWFKINYPLQSNKSLRLFKRPYFHLAED